MATTIKIQGEKHMGLIKGLKGISDRLEQDGGNGDRVKAKFLKVNDGQQVRIRFLQELDADSPHYNEKNGQGFIAVEHESPLDFKKRAVCTIEDEGRCFGCEQYSLGNPKFKQKVKLYINAEITKEDGSKEVVVLSQGNGPKSVTPQLIEAANEYGSITNREFKLKRKGAGQTTTSYTLTSLDKDEIEYDVTQHELFDLEAVVWTVPYEKQAAYFGGTAASSESGLGSDSDEW